MRSIDEAVLLGIDAPKQDERPQKNEDILIYALTYSGQGSYDNVCRGR
jgi:hypothetical protein